jgi:hypothetical protein
VQCRCVGADGAEQTDRGQFGDPCWSQPSGPFLPHPSTPGEARGKTLGTGTGIVFILAVLWIRNYFFGSGFGSHFLPSFGSETIFSDPDSDPIFFRVLDPDPDLDPDPH